MGYPQTANPLLAVMTLRQDFAKAAYAATLVAAGKLRVCRSELNRIVQWLLSILGAQDAGACCSDAKLRGRRPPPIFGVSRVQLIVSATQQVGCFSNPMLYYDTAYGCNIKARRSVS